MKFIIFVDVQQKFRWRLRAANSEIIATSEAYESKQGVIQCIKLVQRYANIAQVIDLTL